VSTDATVPRVDPKGDDWPSTHWRLTAPESYVLQAPRQLSGVEVFKLALRELVLRRALQVERLEEAGFLRRGPPRSVLRALSLVSEPALAPLLDVHARARQRPGADGVMVEDFARTARREFGRSYARYINEHVYPSLEQRGLLRRQDRKRWLGRTRHEFTPAGHEAAAELEEWLRVGRGAR
jgi:hypothetical protein